MLENVENIVKVLETSYSKFQKHDQTISNKIFVYILYEILASVCSLSEFKFLLSYHVY